MSRKENQRYRKRHYAFARAIALHKWGMDQRCRCCGHPMTLYEVTADHIVEISRGGETVWDNIEPAHEWCNLMRSRQLTEGYIERYDNHVLLWRLRKIGMRKAIARQRKAEQAERERNLGYLQPERRAGAPVSGGQPYRGFCELAGYGDTLQRDRADASAGLSGEASSGHASADGDRLTPA